MIEVSQLTKFYGRHCAVDAISFQVQAGEVVGFLGPNGAGKSTTLKMLTSYLPPTSGTATIAGFDVVRDSLKSRREVGYMPENVPLYDDLRVKEYLHFRGKLKGLSGKELQEAMTLSIEKTGLKDVRRKMIRTLSKGYRQRVGLADALLGSPKLLILDEPTNGLDPNQIRQIRALIRELTEHHTVLISTHILSEVEMICGKVVIIDQGKIKAADTPTNLIQNLRTAGRISLEIHGDEAPISEALSGLESVKKATLESDSAEKRDWHRYSIRVEANTDTRERIARLAAERHWTIKELHRHQATLEEVFVELTRKD